MRGVKLVISTLIIILIFVISCYSALADTGPYGPMGAGTTKNPFGPAPSNFIAAANFADGPTLANLQNADYGLSTGINFDMFFNVFEDGEATYVCLPTASQGSAFTYQMNPEAQSALKLSMNYQEVVNGPIYLEDVLPPEIVDCQLFHSTYCVGIPLGLDDVSFTTFVTETPITNSQMQYIFDVVFPQCSGVDQAVEMQIPTENQVFEYTGQPADASVLIVIETLGLQTGIPGDPVFDGFAHANDIGVRLIGFDDVTANILTASADTAFCDGADCDDTCDPGTPETGDMWLRSAGGDTFIGGGSTPLLVSVTPSLSAIVPAGVVQTDGCTMLSVVPNENTGLEFVVTGSGWTRQVTLQADMSANPFTAVYSVNPYSNLQPSEYSMMDSSIQGPLPLIPIVEPFTYTFSGEAGDITYLQNMGPETSVEFFCCNSGFCLSNGTRLIKFAQSYKFDPVVESPTTSCETFYAESLNMLAVITVTGESGLTADTAPVAAYSLYGGQESPIWGKAPLDQEEYDIEIIIFNNDHIPVKSQIQSLRNGHFNDDLFVNEIYPYGKKTIIVPGSDISPRIVKTTNYQEEVIVILNGISTGLEDDDQDNVIKKRDAATEGVGTSAKENVVSLYLPSFPKDCSPNADFIGGSLGFDEYTSLNGLIKTGKILYDNNDNCNKKNIVLEVYDSYEFVDSFEFNDIEPATGFEIDADNLKDLGPGCYSAVMTISPGIQFCEGDASEYTSSDAFVYITASNGATGSYTAIPRQCECGEIMGECDFPESCDGCMCVGGFIEFSAESQISEPVYEEPEEIDYEIPEEELPVREYGITGQVINIKSEKSNFLLGIIILAIVVGIAFAVKTYNPKIGVKRGK